MHGDRHGTASQQRKNNGPGTIPKRPTASAIAAAVTAATATAEATAATTSGATTASANDLQAQSLPPCVQVP